MLQITVYDAVKKIGTRIELPGAAGAATPAASGKEASA
jgi:hypothetical protein